MARWNRLYKIERERKDGPVTIAVLNSDGTGRIIHTCGTYAQAEQWLREREEVKALPKEVTPRPQSGRVAPRTIFAMGGGERKGLKVLN